MTGGKDLALEMANLGLEGQRERCKEKVGEFGAGNSRFGVEDKKGEVG